MQKERNKNGNKPSYFRVLENDSPKNLDFSLYLTKIYTKNAIFNQVLLVPACIALFLFTLLISPYFDFQLLPIKNGSISVIAYFCCVCVCRHFISFYSHCALLFFCLFKCFIVFYDSTIILLVFSMRVCDCFLFFLYV